MIRRLCFGLVFLLLCSTAAHAEMVSISRAKAKMRSGPGTKYPIKWELGIGYPLQVVSRKGSWLKVTDYDSDTGWVYKTMLAQKPYMIVKNEKAIIRKEPGEDQRIVGNASRGVVLRTLKHKDGWVHVRHESGLTGWIRRNQLWGW